MNIPGLDQLNQYLPYILAGLFLVTSIAHRQGKSVPILSALLDMLTGGKLPVPAPTPSPVTPNPAPVSPQHPLLAELLALLQKVLLEKALMQNQAVAPQK